MATVVVTGASGFTGSYFASLARKKNLRVFRLVRDNREQSDDSIVFSGCARHLSKQFAAIGCDAIIHCAASYSPADEIEKTNELLQANIVYPTLVLQAARAAKVPAFVNLGSLWEHDGTGARAPINYYAQLKLAFQDTLSYFSSKHGLRAITLKLADTYAEYDTRAKLFSLLWNAYTTGSPLKMTSGRQTVRPIHIEDVLYAMFVALDRCLQMKTPCHEAYVAAGQEALTVRDIVARAQHVWGQDLQVEWDAVAVDGFKPANIWLDGKTIPGWSPKIALNDGLERFIRSG